MKRIVDREFVPAGQTVNFQFHCDVLRLLREHKRKRFKLCQAGNWSLHHNNAPSHRLFFTQTFFLRKTSTTTAVHHLPYSPDFSTSDFVLFLKMILQLKNRRSDSIEDIREESQVVLNSSQKIISRISSRTGKKKCRYAPVA